MKKSGMTMLTTNEERKKRQQQQNRNLAGEKKEVSNAVGRKKTGKIVKINLTFVVSHRYSAMQCSERDDAGVKADMLANKMSIEEKTKKKRIFEDA